MTPTSTARMALWSEQTEQIRKQSGRPERQLIDVEFNASESTVWAYLTRNALPVVTNQLLGELGRLSENIRTGRYGNLRYRVISSRNPKAFSLGGDLALFLDLIRQRDRSRLFEYGKAAVDEIWANISGCGCRDLVTVALVNGEAQGGGFEAALSCHLLVAEMGTNFGFPEPLFGMFPGMGGIPLLRARSDALVARKLLETGNRYTAEFLYEIGVVDYLARRGEGEMYIRALSKQEKYERAQRRKTEFAAIPYQDLIDTVERWVDRALLLREKNQRSMKYLLNAQQRTYSSI